ncbi:MAG: helix-turn-helix transcriptional regulator [Deltaproteobacteria bacterium]|jgi:transcriptional regulator with XRE-family HTH domain|nr:helix-turn-helix transcriptional regulator [Deltaproteobacteria bacterium]
MLRELGEGLRIARLRRRQSQVDFAERLMVSRATLQRMERGDPSVALGAWVSAAWLLQRLSDLQHVFDPDFDEAGKRMERRYLPTRGKKSQTIRLGRSNELNNDF